MFFGILVLCIEMECKIFTKTFEAMESCKAAAEAIIKEQEGLNPDISGSYKCEAKGVDA